MPLQEIRFEGMVAPVGPQAGVAMLGICKLWQEAKKLLANPENASTIWHNVFVILDIAGRCGRDQKFYQDYRVKCNAETNPPSILDAGKIRFEVWIQEIEAVEFWAGRFVISCDKDDENILIIEYKNLGNGNLCTRKSQI